MNNKCKQVISEKHKKIKTLDIILIILFVSLSCIVTLQKITNESLEKESQVLNKSLGAAKAGRWLYKIDEDQLIWDDGMYKLFNLPHQKELKLSNFTNSLYEKDKDRIINIMDEVMKNNTTYYARYRAVGQNDEIIEIVAFGGMIDNNTFAGICLPRVRDLEN